MKTDSSIYTFLATGPEAFRVLTGGLTLEGEYVFRSVTFKSLERRADGLYEPLDPDRPVYLIEFQAQSAAAAWYNLLTKIGLYGEEHPEREVRGLLIVLHARALPTRPSRVGAPESIAAAICLERFLPEWLEREPDNPFLAALAPLIITRDAALTERAPALWHAIQHAPLEPAARTALSQILEFWLFERFRSLTAEEISTMLNIFTPLEETRAYQSIFVKGEAKGKAEGEAKGKAEGKADSLKRLLTRRFGPLPAGVSARIDSADIPQLDAWLDAVLDIQSLDELLTH